MSKYHFVSCVYRHVSFGKYSVDDLHIDLFKEHFANSQTEAMKYELMPDYDKRNKGEKVYGTTVIEMLFTDKEVALLKDAFDEEDCSLVIKPFLDKYVSKDQVGVQVIPTGHGRHWHWFTKDKGFPKLPFVLVGSYDYINGAEPCKGTCR